MTLLSVDHVSVNYGAVQAIRDVSFTVGRGEIVTLIGANGAGKSTTLRAVSGVIRPSAGSIVHDGKSIAGLPSHRIARLGIAHVPEGRGVFANMSVRENLEMGAYGRRDRGGISSDFERVFELFPVLSERERQVGGTLSGGEQQMLAIGRALMSRPRLLMLDEPSMGLAPLLVEKIFDLLKEIHAQGTTILLIEQNANKALTLADRGYVIESGSIVLEDAASSLLGNDLVRQAYLGEG